jgi:hypothetical protein
MREFALETPVVEHGVYSATEQEALDYPKGKSEVEREEMTKHTRVVILSRQRAVSICLTLEENDPAMPGKRCWHLSMVEFYREDENHPAHMRRFEGGWANHFVQRFLGEATEVEAGVLKAVRHFLREYQEGERIDPRGVNEHGEVEA